MNQARTHKLEEIEPKLIIQGQCDCCKDKNRKHLVHQWLYAPPPNTQIQFLDNGDLVRQHQARVEFHQRKWLEAVNQEETVTIKCD